jgi:hypothetical protein
VYGPGRRAYTAKREAACHLEHAPHDVVPFVITSSGQLGQEAEDFVRKVHHLSGGKLAGGLEPSATIPNCELYWHRRLRLYTVAGFASMMRAVTGDIQADVQPGGELSVDFVSAEVERLTALIAAAHAVNPPVVLDSSEDDGMNVSSSSEAEDEGYDTGMDGDSFEASEPMSLSVAEAAGIPILVDFSGARHPAGWCCEGYVQRVGSGCIGCGGPVGPSDAWLRLGRVEEFRRNGPALV